MIGDESFALHLTWTCYGTWLPGDERGYVSNTLNKGGGFDPKENLPGTSVRKDDGYTRDNALRLLKHPPVRLDDDLALLVAQMLVQAAETRKMFIRRAAIMANHLHVLVQQCPDDGPLVRRILKGSTQAALSRSTGHPRKWWTSGGSDRYKHGESAILAAEDYITNQEYKLAEVVAMTAQKC